MAKKKNELSAVISLQDNFTAQINKIITSTDSAEKKMESIVSSTNEFSKTLSDIRPNAEKASNGVNSLVGKMAALVSVGYAIRTAFNAAWGAINTAATQAVQLNTIQAILGNDEVGQGLYNWIGDYAKTSMLGREDIGKGIQSFLATTRDFGELQQLVGMVERLYAKDPNQGTEGAVFAIKEILSGDVMSMRSRYNITGFDGQKIRDMIAGGNTGEAIEYISGILDKFGASEAVVEKNSQSLITQLNILTSNFKTDFGESMMKAATSLVPVIQQLSEDLSAGKFKPFFDVIAVGSQVVINVFGLMARYADILVPAVGGVVTALIAYKTAAAAVTLYQQYLNMAMLACPATWIAVALGVGAAALGVFLSKTQALKNTLAESTKLGGVDYDSPEFAQALANTKVPVTLDNETVKVTGDVQIEQDNLKYLLDIAQREYVAKFTTATMAPQINVQFGDVHETADVNKVVDALNTQLTEMIATEAEGLA